MTAFTLPSSVSPTDAAAFVKIELGFGTRHFLNGRELIAADEIICALLAGETVIVTHKKGEIVLE